MVLPFSSSNAEAGPSRSHSRRARPTPPTPPSPSASLHPSLSPSLRTPASLRTLHRTPRKASTPSLSLVYAQGDATAALPRTDSPTDIPGQSRASLASGAEDALSRQLIRDSGGTRMGMGLRSRTGSEATVRSVYSVASGVDGGEGREGLGAGDGPARQTSHRIGPGLRSPLEGDEPNGAGASRRHTTDTSHPSTSASRPSYTSDPAPLPPNPYSDPQSQHFAQSDTLHPTISRTSHRTARTSDTLASSSAQSGDTSSIRTVNPKKSDSWLRWNAPGPQFPRSRAGSVIVPANDAEGATRQDGADGTLDYKGKGRAGQGAQGGSVVGGAGGTAPLNVVSTSGGEVDGKTDEDESWRDRHDTPGTNPSAPGPVVPASRPPDAVSETAPGAVTADLPTAVDGSAVSPGNSGADPAMGTVRRTGWQAWIWGSGVPIPEGQPESFSSVADRAAPEAVPEEARDSEAADRYAAAGSPSPRRAAHHAEVDVRTGSAVPAALSSTPLDQRTGQSSSKSDIDTSSKAGPPDQGDVQDVNGSDDSHAPVPSTTADSKVDKGTVQAPETYFTAAVPQQQSAQSDARRQGWGGYLYSYVSRTPSAPAALPESASAAGSTAVGKTAGDNGMATRDDSGSSLVEADAAGAGRAAERSRISPILDGRTLPAGGTKPSSAAAEPVQEGTPTSAPNLDSLPNAETSNMQSTAGPSIIQPSTPQAQGWLSFLARRAAQRTIRPVSSSLDGRLDADTNVGETMDFSNDPNFPSAARASEEGDRAGVVDTGAVLSKDAKATASATAPTSSMLTSASSQPGVLVNGSTGGMAPGGLVIRNKRLSISSGRSIGASPLSTSPRTNANVSTLVNGTARSGDAASLGKAGGTASLDAKGTASKGVGAVSTAPANSVVNGRSSPASSVRSMPAAVTSTTTGTAKAAASPPRPTSTSRLPNAASVPLNGSTLAFRPPNVITPSLDDTFNRPPRSLLPLDEEMRLRTGGGAGGESAGSGSGSGTVGKLAWRAWGTASYYMYGAATDPPASSSQKPSTLHNGRTDSSDTSVTAAAHSHADADADAGAASAADKRGLGAARTVGSTLPRLLGLNTSAFPPTAGSPSPTPSSSSGYDHVRRVVVVGVHGWFPAKMLNSVIGEPTGTSVKFSSMMAEAVRAFFDEVDGVGQEGQGGGEEGDGGEDGKAKGKGEGRRGRDLRVTEIPLEGEGTIEHRVDRLYKAYLSNPAWINDLRRADAIFFAAHSQGCIVTTHLISRMIAQGHIRTAYNADAVARCEWAFGPIGVVPSPPSATFRVPTQSLSNGKTSGHKTSQANGSASTNPRSAGRSASTPDPNEGVPGSEGGYQKVCLLDMCGVHLGPLYSISTSSVIQPYLQWFENAAARELFEFQDSGSVVSREYAKALEMVLEHGVKVVLLASLNDQVVPIYGASFSTASHPLLLRALFVDGASYSSSDFMIKLLNFAFMLRNAGLDDQRLVEHLSEATAGSLTGLGHSTPYEEPASYALAVSYLFRTGPARAPVSSLQIEPFSARDARNDYELPWIMRALVDSPEVQDLFPRELAELKEGVVGWKPVTKVLKEIKKRLEPMAGRQSKLRNSITASTSGPSGAGTAEGQGGVNGLPAGGLKRDW